MKWYNIMFLGAVIGTVVCSMLNTEEPVEFQEIRDNTHHRPNNTNQKVKVKKSKSTKLYFNLLLFFIINIILFCL